MFFSKISEIPIFLGETWQSQNSEKPPKTVKITENSENHQKQWKSAKSAIFGIFVKNQPLLRSEMPFFFVFDRSVLTILRIGSFRQFGIVAGYP